MDDGDWDLMSIVRSCKATTFTNPIDNFETPPPPPTPITITTTNNITPTQNTTSSYFTDSTMDDGDWDLMSIVRSCKATTFTNHTANFETPPPPPTPITITTTNNITLTQNTTPSYFTDSTMDDRDWDLMSIVRSCKATTFTNPTDTFETSPPPPTPITITTTNNIIPTQNTTPSYFTDFTVAQKNNQVHVAPLKPIDFIDLEKFGSNFNHNNTLSILKSVIPNPATSSPISTTTTPTTPATTIPTFIATAPFDRAYNHPSFPQQPIRQHNQLSILLPQSPITTTTTNNIIAPQNTTPSYLNNFTVIQENNSNLIPPFKPTDFIDLEKFRFNLNHSFQIPTTIIPNSTTITTPTIITTPTTSIPTIIPTTTTTTTFPPISTTTIPVSSTTTILTQIPTAHFDCAYNHSQKPINCPSVPQLPPRQNNQLPNLQPQASSRVLPNIYPQKPKCKSRKRKNYDQVSLVCHVKKENLSKDWWVWSKYGQKSIKGSPHPRSYYKCNTSKDCSAKKLVEQSKTIENTYVVTYIGVHNHEKPLVNRNFRKWSYLSSQSSQTGE